MNKDFPKISIITAFYNEERFLSEAIESVLKQGYENWELMLVDDGSSDGSTSIAKEFAGNYPDKIFYLEHSGHSNRGLSSSRQLALNNSRGELIALLDADDIWTTNKLDDQYKLFKKLPDTGMSCEASVYWYSWANEIGSEDVLTPIGAEQDQLHEPPSLMWTLYPLGKGAAPCPSGLMFSRNAITCSGGFDNGFTGDKQLYEDQAFLAKIYSREKVFISSKANNFYRQRAGSLVESIHKKGGYKNVRKFFLDWLTHYLESEKISNRKVDSLIKRALFPYKHPRLYSILSLFSNKVRRIIKTQ